VPTVVCKTLFKWLQLLCMLWAMTCRHLVFLTSHCTSTTVTFQHQRVNGHLRRWADKFCLHCNIFIYVRYIRIKPVLCSRMVSLFHRTSPWTHRCLQSSPSTHRNGRVFGRSVQTACCYWILNCRKSSSNWNAQMNASRFMVISVLMWVW